MLCIYFLLLVDIKPLYVTNYVAKIQYIEYQERIENFEIKHFRSIKIYWQYYTDRQYYIGNIIAL